MAMGKKAAEVRKKLSVAYTEMEKANEKSLMKAAQTLKELEASLSADLSPAIPVDVVSGARKTLGVGRILDAQAGVANAIRMIDAAGDWRES